MMHLGLNTVPTLRDCLMVGECTFDYKYIYKCLEQEYMLSDFFFFLWMRCMIQKDLEIIGLDYNFSTKLGNNRSLLT